MTTLRYVQDDTAPRINIQVKRKGVVVDLTGATVKLFMKLDGTVVNSAHPTCSVTSAASGQVYYDPQAGDFSETGDYKCDVQVTYGSGKVETDYDYITIKVREKNS